MLQKVKFAPGFNKQVTSTGGESQWVAGDNVRFRYGSPEKIGGWSQLGSVDITGRNTAIHHFINTSGIKYAALGTNRILYVYSGGIFYDIHPIKSTTTLTSAFSTTNGSPTVTITFSGAHNIAAGEILLLDKFNSINSVKLPMVYGILFIVFPILPEDCNLSVSITFSLCLPILRTITLVENNLCNLALNDLSIMSYLFIYNYYKSQFKSVFSLPSGFQSQPNPNCCRCL